MKPARIAVLGVALFAGLGAAFLASAPKPPEKPVAPPPPVEVATDDVLVAAKELGFGSVLTPADLRWDSWPKDHIPDGLIRRSLSPNAPQELQDYTVRVNFAAGEPLRRDHLSKSSDFLATILRPGMRAVAINIDTQGSSTAGGFILPDNRVDVVHTFLDSRNGGNSFFSQIILSNVRVLAMGQLNQEKKGEHVITGVNVATLELTPTQAEAIIVAQRTGQLSLILRGLNETGAGESKDSVTGERYEHRRGRAELKRNTGRS
ncbi:MAG TPA: Flp pilus assembly protein CpaB [Methylocella sp.]|nr:Flp pilus assembly protein CpaB [Methylocella sp.]